MLFVRVDRKYIAEVYQKVDKQVMINHKDTGVEKDRLNALLVRIKYKGKNREFALPLSHAIKMLKNHKLTYYPLDNLDKENQTVGGLFFKKCLPVNQNLYKKTNVTKEPFLTLFNLVNKHENDIVKKFNVYLDEYIAKQSVGKCFNCCTNIDAIMALMDKRYPTSHS